jgi:hypothetical protein
VCAAPARTKEYEEPMNSRTVTTTTAMSRRAADMRRLRRRSNAAQRPYCRTNGCASFLEVDPATGVAECPVCGFTRRLH